MAAANKAVTSATSELGTMTPATLSADVNTLNTNAKTTKATWNAAIKVVSDKDEATSAYNIAKADVDPTNSNSAVAKAAAAKAAYDALPD